MAGKVDDEIAEAVITAANREAEKDDAIADAASADAAATGVAAAQAGAAIATAEAAKATQRAAEDIERNQGENAWLKEQAEISRKNFELLAENQNKLDQKTTALAEGVTGLVSMVQSLIPPKSDSSPEVNPEKESASEDAPRKERRQKSKPQRRFI